MVYMDVISACITTDKALYRQYQEMLSVDDGIGISITYDDWIASLADIGLLKSIMDY